MTESTWAGLRWWGDEVSQNQVPENQRGFSKAMVANKWGRRLGALDKAVLNYLLADVFEWYGYPNHRRDNIFISALMAPAIFVPTGYEQRYLSLEYLLKVFAEGNPKKLAASFYHSLQRVVLFHKWFFRRNFGTFYKGPIINGLTTDKNCA